MLISNGMLSPLGLADSTPQYANATYYPNTSLPLVNERVHYGEIYRRQLWIYVLINKVAKSVARLPLKVYEKGTDGRQVVSDGSYARLLAKPNDFHDPKFFWLWTASTFEVYGEAMWLKDRGGVTGPPVKLWPLHPANMNVRRATQADVDGGSAANLDDLVYERFSGVSSTPPQAKYPSADIVHFRSYNPNNQVRGLSQLEPLRLTLLNEDAARRATTSMWNRGNRPGVILKHPQTFKSDATAQRLRAQFDATGGVDNVGRTVVLEEGMEAQIVQLTAEEAQYIETRKLNREEACAVVDVPPPAVHILDHATFSNITENLRSLYRDTMAPRIGAYESVLEAQLRPEFAGDGTYAEFLMDEVLRGSFEQRAQAYEVFQRIAGMTPAEIRDRENLPYLGPATDRLYVNAATVPLEEAGRNTKVAPESGVVPANQMLPAPVKKSLKQSTVRSVMGRVGGKSLNMLDPDRLVAGLNGEASMVLDLYMKALVAGDSPAEFQTRLMAGWEES